MLIQNNVLVLPNNLYNIMIQFKKQLVTPAIAEKLLTSNRINRRVRNEKVKEYANEMSLGKWMEDTGETIKITKCGNLIDGQHRLLAIVLSQTPTYLHFSEGHDYEIFKVLDTGAIRSANDVFLIDGITGSNRLPSTITFYNNLKEGFNSHKQRRTSTNNSLLEQYKSNEDFWNIIIKESINYYMHFNKLLAPSFIGGLYAYLFEFSPINSKEFLTQLTSGVNIQNQSINLLRNALIKDKMSLRKMTPQNKVALIIKTYNAFVLGKEIKSLKYTPLTDSFPIPIKGY